MSSNSRPAKRQRRSTVVISDDDDEDQPSTKLRMRNRDIPIVLGAAERPKKTIRRPSSNKHAVRSTSSKSSPLSSPAKSQKSKKLTLDASNNKSLHSFFSKVADEQRWQRRSFTPEVESQSTLVDDDIVDDCVENKEVEMPVPNHQPQTAARRKSSVSSTSQPNSATSSQRFRKPTALIRTASAPRPIPDSIDPDHDYRPWAERYAPNSLDEIAVHKKKVADVQRWLADSLAGRSSKKLLVLKGPAGSGKSTCIDLIAKAQKLDLVRWQNATTSETGALSNSLQFAEFISRGGEYGALSFGGDEVGSVTSSQGAKLLVVEDFPVIVTRSSTALDSLRTVLLQYLAEDDRNTVFDLKTRQTTHPPIVLVISETLTSSSTTLAESFTAHRLLGSELLNHARATTIEFNPVAPMFVARALDQVIRREARDSGRRRIPGSALLAGLARTGDIRNAVNSLELVCARGDETASWSGAVAANPKKSNKNQPLSETEENSVKLISSREASLDIFHAAGKVVYNKREDPKVLDTRAQPPPKPPDHLLHLYNPKASQVDVEVVFNDVGTDVQTFISTLHENYVLSCNHDDFTDYLDNCVSYLSDAELLDPDRRPSTTTSKQITGSSQNVQPGTSDALRQDEISFQIATRGLLRSLPSPVSRAAPPGSRKQDAFKMYYPASLRLWKPTEEMRELIALVGDQLSNPEKSSSIPTLNNDSVSAWKSRSNITLTAETPENQAQQIPFRNTANQDTLTLEILPYLTHIRAAEGKNTSQLRKITVMNGPSMVTQGMFNENDDGDDLASRGMERATGRVKLEQRINTAETLLQRERAIQSKTQTRTPRIDTDIYPGSHLRGAVQLEIEDDAIEDSE